MFDSDEIYDEVDDDGDCFCEICGERIYNGDRYYLINHDNNDHPVCIDDVIEYLDANCRSVDEDGCDVYVVSDTTWDCEDELNDLLKFCMKIHGEEDLR